MTLRLFNTLSRNLEAFDPLVPNRVGLYVCGVTVYDDIHLGHARAALSFEIIRCYLRFTGYEVTYVRNFTDVDDKIIARAQEEGSSSEEIAERYIRAFSEDMGRLGVPTADIEPRATEHVSAMVEMIESLIQKGFAYASAGDVYFAVREFDDYGKLSRKNLDDLKAGARVEVNEQKRDPLDFALWKAAKSGEPNWDSPWGKGRPGWHIECSVMSHHVLGETFDIHGGGEDLIFPHHENELAQSCAYTGGTFARYWLHNGLVHVQQEKMSKSTGNFFTLKAILEKFRPEVVRFFLVSAHYRSALEYSDDGITAAGRSLDRLYNACLRAEEACAAEEAKPATDKVLDGAVRTFESDFTEGMDNDINTPQAIGAMFTLAREIHGALNRAASTGVATPTESLKKAICSLRDRAKVLTFLTHPPRQWFQQAYVPEKTTGADEPLSNETIRRLVRKREEARAQKDWVAADRIRNELKTNNVILEDSATGTGWKRVQE